LLAANGLGLKTAGESEDITVARGVVSACKSGNTEIYFGSDWYLYQNFDVGGVRGKTE